MAGVKLTKEAGYAGAYHASHLREGVDSGPSAEFPKERVLNCKEAGLQVETCVEPICPERTPEKLDDMVLLTVFCCPSQSGAVQRIPITGTQMTQSGAITKIRMGRVASVRRPVMPRDVTGNCTHEHCTLGAAGEASLLWADVGANPRDKKIKTGEGCGETVET